MIVNKIKVGKANELTEEDKLRSNCLIKSFGINNYRLSNIVCSYVIL